LTADKTEIRAGKSFVGEQCRFLGQERALLANNADFWGRKELCWRTMQISGAEKCFVAQQCQFLDARKRFPFKKYTYIGSLERQ